MFQPVEADIRHVGSHFWVAGVEHVCVVWCQACVTGSGILLILTVEPGMNYVSGELVPPSTFSGVPFSSKSNLVWSPWSTFVIFSP